MGKTHAFLRGRALNIANFLYLMKKISLARVSQHLGQASQERLDRHRKSPTMEARRDEMDVIDERALVYVAVLVVCSALAVFAGPARALATFGFVSASVEGAYWVGRTLAGRYQQRANPRAQL